MTTLICKTCNQEYEVGEDIGIVFVQLWILEHVEHDVTIKGMEAVWEMVRVFTDERRRLNEEMRPLYDALMDAVKQVEEQTGETQFDALARDLDKRKEGE